MIYPCFLSLSLPPSLPPQRYLYYIQRGIDTDHVAPLEDSAVLSVMTKLKPKLTVRPASLPPDPY